MTQKRGSGRTKGANRKTSADGRWVAYTSLTAVDKADVEAFGAATSPEGVALTQSTVLAILIRRAIKAWKQGASASAA